MTEQIRSHNAETPLLPPLAEMVKSLASAEAAAYDRAAKMSGEDREWQHGYAAGVRLALTLLDQALAPDRTNT